MITRETLNRLEFDKILQAISLHAHSKASCSFLMQMAPYSDSARITEFSNRVAEIRSLARYGINLNLSEFDDILPLLETLRPQGAILSPLDLLRFKPVLTIFRDCTCQIAPRNDMPLIKSLEPQLRQFPDILEPLTVSIDYDGSIMDSSSYQLKEIRNSKRVLTTRIRKKIEEIIRYHHIETFLQDDFITQRSGRWVIPIRMDSKGMVNGIVHDISSSGETAFMEPLEIIPFVNELENLASEEKAEEIRILRQLSTWIRDDAIELAECFKTLVTLDVLNAVARFADLHHLEEVPINTGGDLRLVAARHPLLLMMQQRGSLNKIEPLDLHLSHETSSIMVITGPNAGGKTIALKTAGVLTVMALCGLPLPANAARSTIPVFKTLLVDIGDEQSIEQSLSTFSAHISRVTAILTEAGSDTLVLLDELGAGTEPHQGAAIACGVLHELLQKSATVIATTHLTDIIGFAHRSPGMINAGMEYDETTYTPLYKLICGQPGQSHAIDIARRFGMPDSVIAFARDMLGSASSDFAALLTDLHRQQTVLEESRRQLDMQQLQVQATLLELEQRASEIELARREALSRGWIEAKELISSSRSRINELMNEYKRSRRTEVIEKIRQQEKLITDKLKPVDVNQSEHQAAKDIKPGDIVYIPSLGHDGSVVSIDTRSGIARVQTGSMKIDIESTSLCTSASKNIPKIYSTNVSIRNIVSYENTPSELKLIGLHVEEALVQLETFLNKASLAGQREVRIIHGLGSGRLRDAVRKFLLQHPLVDRHRPGESHEGRDGATIALLN